jgi:tetratricopeptide (TPR) repeat protein
MPSAGSGDLARAARLALALLLAHAAAAGAHPDLEGPLAALTARIQEASGDATLYLERGDLYRAHEDLDAALADYERAAEHGADPLVVHFAEGDLLLEAGWPRAAEIHLDRVLAVRPDHERALLARARARVRLGRPTEAAADFTRAIALMRAPKPDHYVERARALVAAGEDDEALRGLDEGIERLGQLAVLNEEAIDIELAHGRWERALERLGHLLDRAPGRPAWLAQRGRILERAARHEEARAAFAAALAALESRQAHRRRPPATAALEREVRAALVRLDVPTD